MKILTLTDIHGAYHRAEEIIKKESPDILIIGGDLTTLGTMGEAENAIKNFRLLSRTIFCIAGNMDFAQHDELFHRLGVSLNACGVIAHDIGFFGVSSAPISPLHTPYEISEEEIARRIQRGYQDVQQATIKILVAHAPPYGTKVDIIHLGYHVGSTAVRDFIEEHQPDLVICGHIHEGRGQDTIEKTMIVNCGTTKLGCYGRVEISGRVITVKNLQDFSSIV